MASENTGRARIADALMSGAYASGRSAEMSNLAYGGQYGFATEQAEWVHTTHYTSKNLIVLVLDTPAGFKYMPEPEKWDLAYKAMFEKHPKTIEGFNKTLTVSFAETPVGGSGQVFHDITDVKRAASDVSATYTDLYGRPMQNFLEDLITIFGMDPETKVPNLITFLGQESAPTDMLNDISHGTIIAFEPSASFNRVDKAWLMVNVFPESTGDITGKRDMNSEGQLSEFTVNWKGTCFTSYGIVAFAQSLLNSMNLLNANAQLRPAYIDSIAPEVVGDGNMSGYAEGVNKLATEVSDRISQ